MFSLKRKPSIQELLILHHINIQHPKPIYGLNLMDVTGLGSGTIYPTLLRFEDRQWIKGEWESIESSDAKRPKRRLYQLTPDGKDMANMLLTEDVITMLSNLIDFQKKTAKPKTI